MDRVRHALGLEPHQPPPLSAAQSRVQDKLDRAARRLAKRQEAIDIQVEVLRADRADARRPR